jgi:hypothetical protein
VVLSLNLGTLWLWRRSLRRLVTDVQAGEVVDVLDASCQGASPCVAAATALSSQRHLEEGEHRVG